MNQTPTCFVIMPFGKQGSIEYQQNLKIYRQMIKPVVEICGYKCIRADELEHFGNITRDIIEHLYTADLVVADLSGKNANVFYELGVRHALFSCGTIPIIREGESLPFDIANYRIIFYPKELRDQASFKKELKNRIRAFNRPQNSRSDNPVHEILGEKLKHKTTINIFEPPPKRNFWIKYKIRIAWAVLSISIIGVYFGARFLEGSNLKSIFGPVEIRTKPNSFTGEEITKMLETRGFFDKYKNENGSGWANSYEPCKFNGAALVIDHSTRLMWQQAGSVALNYENAEKYIAGLNQEKFGGFSDWRLPTLEEAMSLMEPEAKNGDLCIDPVFEKTQWWIWTADAALDLSEMWIAVFVDGGSSHRTMNYEIFVRAVRSWQPPES